MKNAELYHRPFETFCRSHFVDKSGSLRGDLKIADDKFAECKRKDHLKVDIIRELGPLKRSLDNLYKLAKEEKAAGDEKKAVGTYLSANEVRERVGKLKARLKKLK